MRFLAFVDLHQNVKKLKAIVERAKEDDIDFLICAGDLSNFGQGLATSLKKLNSI